VKCEGADVWLVGAGAQSLVHGPDDVAAHGELAKRLLKSGLQDPAGWSGGLRQGEALQFRSSAQQQPAQLWIFGAGRAGPQIRHPAGRVGDVAQPPVETGPALGINLAFKARANLMFATWPELEGTRSAARSGKPRLMYSRLMTRF
jgi:hypothetical protein